MYSENRPIMRTTASIRHKMATAFVIGAPKCGTTSLYESLALHPQVSFSSQKEPRYFSNQEKWDKGEEWYHSLFDNNAKAHRIDGSTSYSEAWRDRYKISAQRIHRYNPEAKIIYCVRNPISRMISEWKQVRYLLSTGHPFIASTTGMNQCTTLPEDVMNYPGFLGTSNYWECIRPYRELFGDDQIQVLFLEDLREDPKNHLTRVAQFLDIDKHLYPVSSLKHTHDSKHKGEVNRLGRLLIKMPFYKTLASRSNVKLKRLIRPILKGDANDGVTITPELRNFVRDKLSSPTKKFIVWQGKPDNYYKL